MIKLGSKASAEQFAPGPDQLRFLEQFGSLVLARLRARFA